MKHLLLSLVILLLGSTAATAAEPVEAKLDTCVTYYQDGEYQKAVDSLKALIPLISDQRAEAEAYKYLGFSYVMLDMIGKAKDFFKVALEKFPQMTIDTLEVPPNITVVFKQTQLEAQMENGELVEKGAQDHRVMIVTLLSATSAVSGLVGGYFLYSGQVDRQVYKNLNAASPPDRFSYYWDKQQKETIIGASVLGFAIATGATAAYLNFKKPSVKKLPVSFRLQENGVLVAWRF